MSGIVISSAIIILAFMLYLPIAMYMGKDEQVVFILKTWNGLLIALLVTLVLLIGK